MPFVRHFAVTPFGIACASTGRKALYADFCMEHRVVILVEELLYQLKGNLHFGFLAPFDKFGFEVDLLARHLVEVDVVLEDFFSMNCLQRS